MNEAYKRVERLGDRLAEIESMGDWEAFRPLVGDMFDNRSERGGRPNIDEVVMVKLLVLQQWHGLSDPELEKQAADKLSFMKFLGFPKDIPDFTTVWYFRERLAKTGKDRAIWAELQRQLDALGLKVRQGVVQDATFITADPGARESGYAAWQRCKDAQAALIARFELSEAQAKEILDMRLSRLSALERDKIETERTELEQKIAWLTEVLASEARIFGVIKEELQDLKSKYGDARRTEIEDVVELNERDFVEENATRMVNGIEALREYVNNVRG